MDFRVARIWRWVTLLSVSVAGCQASSDAEIETAPATVAAASPASPPAENPQPTVAAPSAGDKKHSPAPEDVATFAPPFPERVDFFEPPKRAQSTVRQNDEGGETVELKGFIHVDQPRVLLSIDGVLSPIAEGAEKYGVQVISIHPPSVVLQRGRSRWTATLE